MKGIVAMLVVCCCYIVGILSASVAVDGGVQYGREKEETPGEERTLSILALSSVIPLMRKFFHKIFGKGTYQ